MGFNICAVVGAVIAVAGCLLASGLFITQEIAEVFVAKGGGELSCAIGNLGIQTAAYDPRCLSDAELEGSNLGSVNDDGSRSLLIEPFSSDTEEFKLLFPSQQDFQLDFNLAFILINACIELELSDTCVPALLEAFPEFDGDCELYWDLMAGSQPQIFGGAKAIIDPLLFSALVGTPFKDVLTPYFNDSKPLVGAYVLAVDGFFRSILFSQFSGATTFGADPTAVGTELGTIKAIASANLPAPTNATIGLIVDGINPADCVDSSPLECLDSTWAEAKVDLSGSVSVSNTLLLADYSAAFCEPLTTDPVTCTVADFAGLAAVAASQINAASPSPDPELARAAKALVLLQRIGQLATDGTANGITVPSLATFQGFVNTAPAKSAEQIAAAALVSLDFGFFNATTSSFEFFLPYTYPTNSSAQFPACNLLQALGVLPTAIGEAGCTFQVLTTSIEAIAVAAEADDLLLLAGPLDALFAQCYGVQGFQLLNGLTGFQAANDCFEFFAVFGVNTAFSNAFEAEIASFSPGSDAVYEAAKEACIDDEADLVAIATAQNMVPVGIVFFALGAVAALAAAGLNNKVIALISGLLLVLAGVLILAALATVYGAPIYESVRDPEDSELNDVIYVAGKTINIGVFSIVLAIASGICMVISAIMMHRSADEAEVKALGGGDKSTVSI